MKRRLRYTHGGLLRFLVLAGLVLPAVVLVVMLGMSRTRVALREQQVRGVVVDVQEATAESALLMTLRDDQGISWTFLVEPAGDRQADGLPVAEHVQQHAGREEPVLVSFRRSDRGLVVVQALDVEGAVRHSGSSPGAGVSRA